MNCVFCKILAGDIKSEFLYEDKTVVAIHDIDPKAPTHILILPRLHIETLHDANPEVLGQMMAVATQLAKKQGVSESGYRIVLNCNEDGGQSVPHIHAHLLAGRPLTWPPG
jgi:histidine triad (HIT) family protein